MDELKVFLDNVFRSLKGPFPSGSDRVSQRGQAALLGLPQSSYNRILRSARLTPRMAKTWAQGFAGLGSPHTAAELEEGLLNAAAQAQKAAATPSDEIREEVEPFFQRLEDAAREAHGVARNYPLLVVEYRDTPRTEKFRSKYPHLQESAARAVAEGLRMALFQPFKMPSEGSTRRQRDPRAVRDYRRDIGVLVRRVRAEMWEAAEQHARKVRGPEAKPDGMIVHYEGPDLPAGISGIATRTFYVEYFREGTRCREVWEWIAGKERDVFLERDPQSLPCDAFIQQFIGVYRYWQTTGQLPLKAKAIEVARESQDVALDLDMNLADSPSWTPAGGEA